jgi:hypothetical protein
VNLWSSSGYGKEKSQDIVRKRAGWARVCIESRMKDKTGIAESQPSLENALSSKMERMSTS